MRRSVSCLALLLLVLTAGGCGDHTERNEDLVRRMVDAINHRDFAVLDAVVAADVVRHSNATPGVEVRSLEQFKAFLEQDVAGVPDSHIDIQQSIAEGDLVAVRALYAGTQTGRMGPFPPSGGTVELPYISFLRIEDGKIAEIWVEWDNMSMLSQLGHLPELEVVGAAPPSDDNKALARRWFDEVINGRNPDAIADIYADDYVYHGPGGLEIRDLEEVRGFAEAILAASPDRRAEVERQVAEGDLVATHFTSRGTRTGPWQGHPPTGEEWVTEGIVISRIEGERIVEDWEITHSTGL